MEPMYYIGLDVHKRGVECRFGTLRRASII